ncbi:lateral signaling target protein 2 homolog isoform X4 [Chelonia mydas]|uniref:lateral signaling target protein 2 homolog isoform X4 n=1 Tax=Chelonia mydas TaxID=8469 RepID=UPI001CA81506|nr:lateral signaling target protein 2 homolog isoform X4 [Chelonia mydas]
MLPAAVRKWLHRPKRSDPRLLSQFFYADERVTRVVMEINGLDVETDPQQYLVLLNQLHLSQAHLLTLIEQLMNECIPKERHCRDYLAKFPEELLVDNLGNHVLFAAECLVAGTVLELEEADGLQLRPLAKNLVCSLQLVRKVLREQSLSQASPCSEPVRMALIRFDTLFAEFELRYVSLLVSVKSPEELYKQQEIVVLFCETVERALKLGYLSQDMIDGCEPLLMFTIPRLAIISGLLIYPEGPLGLERRPEETSRLFRPFRSMLKNIRPLGQQPGSARGRVLPGAVLPGARSELRSRYSSAQEMIHTLFVCISGVADQLQTNFASDLRSILKTVFHIVTSQPEAPVGTDTGQEEEAGEASPLADCALCSSHREGNRTRHGDGISRLPPWVPDGTCSRCTSCGAPFSMVRRRHHCRSCGKIFCSRCSQHTAPLPHYGLLKPVRVCTHCYTVHLPARPPTPSRP